MKLIDIQQQFFTIKGENGVCFCTTADTDANLNVKVVHYIKTDGNTLPYGWQNADTLFLRGDDLKKIQSLSSGLGMPYYPVSEHVKKQHLNTPDSMGYETHEAMNKLRQAVGGDTTDFVCSRLRWSREEIKNYLFAEQVDAVALIVYNFEARNQSVIIGDQTGIGKGRVAASIIRYAVVNGYIPIFCTEGSNLFTDIYRDLSDINCSKLVPFFINSDDKANITVLDEDDKNVTVYRPITDKKVKEKIYKSMKMPKGYDYILCSYTQLKNTYKYDKKGNELKGDDYLKYEFLSEIADNAIFIFDESHNIAGSKAKLSKWWDSSSNVQLTGSNQFKCFNELCKKSVNSLFLSATFAKQPQNMVVYANRTCIQETGLKDTELIDAISKGNEALQEIISANIVSEGQMIHRESDFTNVVVNYFTLDGSDADAGIPDLKTEHCNMCDYITEIINQINVFEQTYVMPIVDDMNKQVGSNTQVSKTSEKVGVQHTPLFSKLFNIVNQLLFAIKAEAVANHAIKLLNEGKKVVIAVSSTMEAFISGLEDEDTKGQEIPCDFALVLDKALQKTLTIVKNGEGDLHEKTDIPIDMLSAEGQDMFFNIRETIINAVSNISISPLDLITKKIENAINPDTGENYIVTEVTGRSKKIEFTNPECTSGYIVSRKKEKKNIAFSKFQNNQSDVLIINKSGSTGASAHATTKNTNLKTEEVKPRVMIIAQVELDINKEVQKRGRINRTGQIPTLPPRYDYISSAIPAEKRLMMMLQKKLKSLDANTTSNQKQSKSVIDVPDFFNKYGDMLAYDYLVENPAINLKLNNAIKDDDDDNSKKNSKKNDEDDTIKKDFLKKISGWVPLLTCEEQKDFYDTILERYQDLVKELKKKGEYDLEVEALDLDARLVGELKLLQPSLVGNSCFSDAVYQGIYSCKVLQKPYSQEYIAMEIQNYTKGTNAKELAQQIAADYKAYYDEVIQENIDDLQQRCEDRKKSAKEIIVKNGGTQQDIDLKFQEIDADTQNNITSRKNRFTIIKNRARFIEFFYAGRACVVDSDNNTKAICLGLEIGTKTKNKYAPSNLKITFAVASNTKELDFTLVDRDLTALDAIKGLSVLDSGFNTDVDKQFLESWNEYVKESSSDREQRVIIVGNLLRGYGNAPDKSKLISFTTHDGQILKGILTPKNSTDSGTKLIMSAFDISTFVPLITKSVYQDEKKTYSLTRGLKLCTNAVHENSYGHVYKFILYCENANTFKRIKHNQDWLDVSEDGRGFEEYRVQGEKHWSMEFDSNRKLEDVFMLLEKYNFKVELYPSEAQRIFGNKDNDTLKHGNWKPLEVDYSLIPKSYSNLLLTEMKLLKKGLKGLGATTDEHVYGTLEKSDFLETVSQGSMYRDGWKGVFGYRYIKDTKAILQKLFKYFYPEVRFSIKIDHNSLIITIISAPCKQRSSELNNLSDELQLIANGFNYDYSNPMIDFFDKGFYGSVHISEKYQQNILKHHSEFTIDDLKKAIQIIDNGGELKQPKAKKQSQSAAVAVDSAELQIVDYSDKAIILTGDTKPLKDEIKALGGKFGSHFDTSKVSSGNGWLFPKTKLAAIQEFVSKYSKAKNNVSTLLITELKLLK